MRPNRNRRLPLCFFSPAAKSISDRHYGVGCDQVLVLRAPSSPDVFDFRMDVFNSDGSKAEQCANGLRCVAKYFSDVHPLHTNLSTSSRVVDIETAAGHVTATVSLTSLSLYKYDQIFFSAIFIHLIKRNHSCFTQLCESSS